MRREFALMSLLVAAITVTSCMQPSEPTPLSTVMSIKTLNTSTRGEIDEGLVSDFTNELRVRNIGSRTVYIDLNYKLTEKLIDQKWIMVEERDSQVFAAVRAIPPGQLLSVPYRVVYLHSTTPRQEHLEHIYGAYRVRLRLAFNANGSDPLPEDQSYSRPFGVTH